MAHPSTARAARVSLAFLSVVAAWSALAALPSRARAERMMSIYDTGARSATSLFVGIPRFLDVDTNVVRPGVAIDGRFGIDWGYFVLNINFGYQANPIDASSIPMAPFHRDPLTRLSWGPGIRFQIPNESRVLPYVSAGFDLAWWHLYNTEIEIGNGVIYSHRKRDFAPGFQGRAGLAIRTSEELYIDLALGFGMSFPGGFFNVNRYWLSPTIGITYRRR